ncbi:phosphoribosylanthranilate isomerase [Elstera litoralis]|uniref:phosphoribosylanthranilate isomerase n=1 Tax=Elstera litoralis TaxID=552518 RepID=UPI00069832E8|nr:phosphoribosylanthranilate isomerase [Elstera litoralis]
MVRVKICGLTRLGDALHAAASGADALGFIVWPGSKRFISVSDLARLRRELPPFVQTVAVTVNATPAEIVAVWHQTGVSAVQLHGDETPEAYRNLPMPIIKAFRAPPLAAELDAWDAVAFLADGAAAGHYGGSGVVADGATVEALAATGRLILAGADAGNGSRGRAPGAALCGRCGERHGGADRGRHAVGCERPRARAPVH